MTELQAERGEGLGAPPIEVKSLSVAQAAPAEGR